MPSELKNISNNKNMPAEWGLWLFLLIDMCIFSLYFWVFAWGKTQYPEIYSDGQATLNTLFGGLNTAVLLVSSFFMATAVHAARLLDVKRFQIFLKLTITGGLIFLIVKTIEYTEKFSAGFVITTNEFYRNYFSFTGFHLLHVIFGLGFLTYLLISIKSSEHAKAKILHIEGAALYWHMVDLLWVVLFSLIYLAP
jgi:nitric oxide reductase NorE protein